MGVTTITVSAVVSPSLVAVIVNFPCAPNPLCTITWARPWSIMLISFFRFMVSGVAVVHANYCSRTAQFKLDQWFRSRHNPSLRIDDRYRDRLCIGFISGEALAIGKEP